MASVPPQAPFISHPSLYQSVVSPLPIAREKSSPFDPEAVSYPLPFLPHNMITLCTLSNLSACACPPSYTHPPPNLPPDYILHSAYTHAPSDAILLQDYTEYAVPDEPSYWGAGGPHTGSHILLTFFSDQ